MVEKVPVQCPKCRVRLRMPLGLRASKRPRCPKCKTIVRPADVLPASLLVPAAPKKPVATPLPERRSPVQTPTPLTGDYFTETKSLVPDGQSREADPYAETVTKLPDGTEREQPRLPLPSDFYMQTKTLVQAELVAARKPLPSDFYTRTKTMVPAEPPDDSVPELPPAAVVQEMDQPVQVLSRVSRDDDNAPPPWATSPSEPLPKPVHESPPKSPGVPVGLEETRIPLPGELPPVGLEETRIPLPGEWDRPNRK